MIYDSYARCSLCKASIGGVGTLLIGSKIRPPQIWGRNPNLLTQNFIIPNISPFLSFSGLYIHIYVSSPHLILHDFGLRHQLRNTPLSNPWLPYELMYKYKYIHICIYVYTYIDLWRTDSGDSSPCADESSCQKMTMMLKISFLSVACARASAYERVRVHACVHGRACKCAGAPSLSLSLALSLSPSLSLSFFACLSFCLLCNSLSLFITHKLPLSLFLSLSLSRSLSLALSLSLSIYICIFIYPCIYTYMYIYTYTYTYIYIYMYM